MDFKLNVIFLKLTILLLIFIAVGVPIINPIDFAILLFCITIIYFAKISINNKKIVFSIFILICYLIINSFIPKIKIQEGDTLILFNDDSKDYYQNNLPIGIYNFLENKFEKLFSYSTCEDKSERCWRYYKAPESSESIFLKSDDWSFSNIEFSRVTDSINISDLTSVRIGKTNSYEFNFFRYESEQDEIERDYIPFLVMYKIPSILENSSICWKGNTFWEQGKNYIYEINNEFKCKKITKNNIGKKIYAISFGNKETLDLKLKKNLYLQIISWFNIVFLIAVILLIFFLNFKFNFKVYLFSVFYLLSYFLLLFYHNKALIYGFEIFPGGMDGMVHITFGSQIFNDFKNLDFFNAFHGGESIFYFLPGLRYFWALNKFFFGDTYYGYLIIPFFYTGLIFFIFKFITGTKIAFCICILNFFTNFFDGYALPNIKMISQVNVGHAEPLAIFFVLCSIVLTLLSIDKLKNNNIAFLGFLLGFCCFLGTIMRPDYLPSCLILLTSFIYLHKCNLSFYKIILFVLFGFSFILLSPIHNYFYGNQLVLFTSNHPIIDIEGSGHNIGVPLGIYFSFFADLIQFKINDNFTLILNQITRWIKPEQVHYIISILIVLYSIFFVKNNIIKILGLMSLSQHAVLLIFQPDHRYAYLAWILTIFVVINFLFSILSKTKFFDKNSYFKKSSTST